MRFFSVLVLALVLCAVALSKPLLADLWAFRIYGPDADAVYTEPVVILPRGEVAGDSCNNTKQVQAEAEFWFQKAGGESVKINSKTWTAKAGEVSGFNFDFSPQLTEGSGWVGIRVLDADGKVIDYKINRFTVKKGPVPLPVNP